MLGLIPAIVFGAIFGLVLVGVMFHLVQIVHEKLGEVCNCGSAMAALQHIGKFGTSL